MSRTAPSACTVVWSSPDGRLHATVRHADTSGGWAKALLVCIHGGGCTGRYFDLRGYSFAKEAAGRGYVVAMVDRPCYGGSPPIETDRPIAEAAELIAHILPRLAVDLLPEGGPVGLIGHSIGGAVALTCADLAPAVAAVAVSGIGAVPSAAARATFSQVQAGMLPDPPSHLFFGPEGSYDWRGPIALRAAGAPWRGDEVRELLIDWPCRFAAIAGAVRQPVHFRLAEHEDLWEADRRSLTDIRRAFITAKTVDVGILPDGGHLYDIHKGGLMAARARLDFLDEWLSGGR